MKRTLAVAEQYMTAALFIFMGLCASGCSDSATVNPVVELASLTVDPGTLEPAFSGGTTQYRVDLSTDIATVTITAQPAVAGDTVTINGQATTSRVITLDEAGTTTPVNIVVSETGTNSRTYTVLLVRAGLTGNNSLQNLAVSPGTLAPAFDPNFQVYTVSVANTIGSVTVTPTLSDLAGTMTVNGQAAISGQPRTISLNPAGQNTPITIVVTAQNGTPKSYLVSVSRGVSNNNNLQGLTVSSGTLSPAFRAGTVGYTVNVGSGATSVTVTPRVQDTTATMTVNGQATNSGQSRAITLLGPGSSTPVIIVVTAQNGTQRTYSISLIRATLGGNNNLSALTVSPGDLTPAFNANRLTYSVDVAEDVTSVTVSATKADRNAVMSGDVTAGAGTTSGSAPIQLGGPGRKVVSITVTAPNGSSKTYTVTVDRATQASNNNLSALTVSPGSLSPSFRASRTNYSVDVDSTVSSVTVSATKADPNAVMSGDVTAGTGTTSGSAPIQLDGPGARRVVSIIVTAPNQSSKTYTITIQRTAQAGNNNLQSLVVSPGSLTPDFDANRTNYTVNVGSSVTSVIVTAAPQDANANVEINGQGIASGQGQEISLGPEGSSTNITIGVNPPNENAKTYRVTVNRASSGDNGNNAGNDGGKDKDKDDDNGDSD